MSPASNVNHRASISDVLHVVDSALDGLGASFTLRQVESLGSLVHEAMSLDSRYYHDVSHAVAVAGTDEPIEQLAGLFHDVVYYHVDRVFAPSLEPIVRPYVQIDDAGLSLDGDACAADRWVTLVCEVFGCAGAARLDPLAGQNELISAIVAAKALAPLLPDRDLAQIIACIEATIPFRGPDAHGASCTQRLARRLAAADERFGLALGHQVIGRALQRAVNVSNRDVASFAAADVTEFLGETWLLFAESNPVLARKRGFFIADYRRSLVAALGFFESLDPDTVFRAHADSPCAATIAAWTRTVRENLEQGAVYLKMKLVGVAIIEALAALTGGDALIAMFMGQVRYGDEYGERLEDYLPERADDDRRRVATGSAVYRLLAQGRAGGSRFDMPDSPITVFLYDRLGQERLLALYPLAASMVAGRMSPAAFLGRVPERVVKDITQACRRMAWTRDAELEQVLQSLYQS